MAGTTKKKKNSSALTVKKKLVMGLSGGMDSVTLMAYYLRQGYEVHACVFTYGSKHNEYENRAALSIIKHYQEKGLPLFGYLMKIGNVMEYFKSDLLLSGGNIPEGHYESESMKSTVVPGRNLIFISIMAGLAESIGAGVLALGVHAGDHHIYPDCRLEFITAARTTVLLSSDGKVSIETPFQLFDKFKILETGFSYRYTDFAVPYELTRTCYKNQELSCGKCGSCVERLEAFEKLGMHDPLTYEE